MIKRILVGLDHTDFAKTSLMYAKDLSQKNGARVTGLAVIDTEEIEDHTAGAGIGSIHYARVLEEKMIAEAEEHTKNIIKNFVDFCEENNILYSKVIESGVPFKILEEDSVFHDIIITGKETHFKFPDKDAPGKTLKKLLACKTVPILAVNDTYKPIENVLIPVTENPKTFRMIRYFVNLGIGDINIHLLHCTHDEKKGEALLYLAMEYLKDYGYETQSYLRESEPFKEILELSSEKECSLIVLASNEKHHLKEVIFGSTTMKIIENSSANILIYE